MEVFPPFLTGYQGGSCFKASNQGQRYCHEGTKATRGPESPGKFFVLFVLFVPSWPTIMVIACSGDPQPYPGESFRAEEMACISNTADWFYRTFQWQQELRSNDASLISALRPLIGQGLTAAIYTQRGWERTR